MVFNRRITTLRARVMGFPAEERAKHAAARVSQLLDRPGAGKVVVMNEPEGRVLTVDGALAFMLTTDDTDRLSGESLDQATQAARLALQSVVDQSREAHDRQRFFQAVLRSAVASLLFVVALAFTLSIRRWVVRRLADLLEERTAGVQLAGAKVLDATRLFGLSRSLVRLFSLVLLGLLTYEWSTFVLRQFPYSRPWGEQLSAFLLDVFAQLGSSVVGALPDLLVALIIFLLARGLIGALHPFFARLEQTKLDAGWLDHDTARATRRILNAAIWIFAAVMAYPYLPGSGSEAFKGMSVLIGLMVTLGGSSLFGQAASGMILLYSRTLRIGELVRVGDQEGTVIELGAFTTRIRSGLGEEITLPNSLVLSSVTKNYSRPMQGHGFVMDTTVTIGYDAPWRQVEAMLTEAARRTPGVLTQRPPEVFKRALGDYYVEYRLVCQASQTDARERAEALSVLNGHVMDVFNEYGVQIMSPHYFADPSAPKVVPPAGWYAAPATPAREREDSAEAPKR
jgi:small-conductance mechanosensitive channel